MPNLSSTPTNNDTFLHNIDQHKFPLLTKYKTYLLFFLTSKTTTFTPESLESELEKYLPDKYKADKLELMEDANWWKRFESYLLDCDYQLNTEHQCFQFWESLSDTS